MSYNFDFKKDNGKYTVEVDTAACYGCFEHNELGDECGGGLWFEVSDQSTEGNAGRKLNLIDYDGVFELSMSVIETLREAGFIVDKDFE